MDTVQKAYRKTPTSRGSLAEIDGIRGELKAGLRMTPQAIESLHRSVLVTSTGASTRIEGSKLSDREVQQVLQGLLVSKFAEQGWSNSKAR